MTCRIGCQYIYISLIHIQCQSIHLQYLHMKYNINIYIFLFRNKNVYKKNEKKIINKKQKHLKNNKSKKPINLTTIIYT